MDRVYRRASDFESWRDAARPLLRAHVAADCVSWNTGHDATGNIAEAAVVPQSPAVVTVRGDLLRLLEAISYHRAPGRWDLMYRLAWRAATVNPRLLEDAADPDVHAAHDMERAVRRACHKMHAFVRFRECPMEDPPPQSSSTQPATGPANGSPVFFAWFEPEHPVLRRAADFFVQRFANMHWTIATPDGAAIWKNHELRFLPAPDSMPRADGDPRGDSAAALAGPASDSFEDLWRLYYRSICNVTRINTAAMRREMPQRYWRHLPEAVEIAPLVRHGLDEFNAAQRSSDEEEAMPKAIKRSLDQLQANGSADGSAISECRRCDLWKDATQAVTGEGPSAAQVMLVGEQPGDQEDLRGHPFVGPAGKVLDGALQAAGLDRSSVFVTNAVKHFKWEPRGKRRLHKKPNVGEITACGIWLEQEIAAVKPAVIVALGATALRALTGRTVSIDAARRETLGHANGAVVVATYHPSAILRADDRAEELRQLLIDDLKRAHELSAK